MQFDLKSPFSPTGHQPQAINRLIKGLEEKNPNQVLLGVTGSGKTYTIANVIQKSQRPTLIISHNKTLAGQLYQEFRDFFPHNAVSYFVSYYDYYQPEAYIPTTDTYIEKSTDINEEIDKLRLLATANLVSRDDVIVIASVSSIYNIGNPDEYKEFVVKITKGEVYPRTEFLLNLTRMQYERSEFDLHRGSFWVKGDTIEIWPAYKDEVIRLHFMGNKLERFEWLDPLTKTPSPHDHQFASFEEFNENEYLLYPSKHFIADPSKNTDAFAMIERDLKIRVNELKNEGKNIEAYRIEQKVHHDLDMMQELGYVNGIENYSRYFDGRNPGDPPNSLMEYFRRKKDWLLVIDESHITIPQIRGMYNGDQARKRTLIDYGFRLPSALDNRPLRFDEFLERMPETVFVSATPGDWEMEKKNVNIVEQVVRPTGLIDPEIEVRPSENQIADLTKEIIKRKKKGQRVLVTTITKRLAEALTDYLNDPENFSSLQETPPNLLFGKGEEPNEIRPKVAYLHSDIDTLDRQDILDDLRIGEYDVLVGINLLREGLDLPEVTLVIILDADKEGFLRSRRSLIQTMGRAARHVEGQVIMYADKMTDSMKAAINEVNRRRDIQIKYNKDNGIEPTTIQKEIKEKLIKRKKEEKKKSKHYSVKLTPMADEIDIQTIDVTDYDPEDRKVLIKRLRRSMLNAAKDLNFEKAAQIRDKVFELGEVE